MSYPPLPVPTDSWPQALPTAYDALIAVLKEDPGLRRLVKTWRTWDGGPEDLKSLGDAQLNWVQLKPIGSVIQPHTESSVLVKFRINMHFSVRGHNVRDLMVLWGSLLHALRFDRPFRDTTVGDFLRSEGNCEFFEFTDAGVTPMMTTSGDFQSGSTIVLSVVVPH